MAAMTGSAWAIRSVHAMIEHRRFGESPRMPETRQSNCIQATRVDAIALRKLSLSRHICDPH